MARQKGIYWRLKLSYDGDTRELMVQFQSASEDLRTEESMVSVHKPAGLRSKKS